MTLPPTQGAPAEPSDDTRDDAALLRDHVAGDAEAFTLLVRRHRSRLWALAVRALAQPEDAAEALQDGFVHAHRHADRFRGEARVSSWLYRIVLNECLDRIESRNRRAATVPLDDDVPDDDSSPRRALAVTDDSIDWIDSRLAVQELLKILPDEQRVPIVLTHIERLPLAEVGELLDVPVGTLKSRLSRGRARLAAELAAQRPRQEAER